LCDVSDVTQDFSLEDVTIEFWMNSNPRIPIPFPAYSSIMEVGIIDSYGVLLADANSIVVVGGGATSYFNSPRQYG